ncbi:MAG TPA: hypothetical protein VK540_08135 [Polyangiaceae bacterium]|nr:hypothetical protein [Polyangiaceae bacterium]
MKNGEIVRVVVEVRLGKDGHEHVHVIGAFDERATLPDVKGSRNVVSVFANRSMDVAAFDIGPPPKP